MGMRGLLERLLVDSSLVATDGSQNRPPTGVQRLDVGAADDVPVAPPTTQPTPHPRQVRVTHAGIAR